MKKKIEIFITLGPSTINKTFLKKIKRNIKYIINSSKKLNF